MSAGKFLTAIMTAFAAGVAIGMLYAPDKGSNTRQKIADTKDDWQEKYEELRDTVREKWATAKQARSDIASKSKEVMSAIKGEGQYKGWTPKNTGPQNYNG